MALLPVTILAFNHIIFSSAEDSCPKEINTIFSKRNDLNDCKDQKDPPKNLNITNFKPDPPEISKLYDGNILVRWAPPTQWIKSEDLLFVLELLESEIFDDEDDDDEEDRIEMRRDFSLSTREDGVLEIPLDVNDDKYWGVTRVRVRIQGNYQVSEFSKEVKVNVLNAKDEKEFLGKLDKMVRDGAGKTIGIKM